VWDLPSIEMVRHVDTLTCWDMLRHKRCHHRNWKLHASQWVKNCQGMLLRKALESNAIYRLWNRKPWGINQNRHRFKFSHRVSQHFIIVIQLNSNFDRLNHHFTSYVIHLSIHFPCTLRNWGLLVSPAKLPKDLVWPGGPWGVFFTSPTLRISPTLSCFETFVTGVIAPL